MHINPNTIRILRKLGKLHAQIGKVDCGCQGPSVSVPADTPRMTHEEAVQFGSFVVKAHHSLGFPLCKFVEMYVRCAPETAGAPDTAGAAP